MPARKPTGAATSSETRTSGCQSSSGCQPPHQRKRHTSPKPMPPKSGVIQSARTNPGPRSSLRAPPRLGGAVWTSWSAVTAVTSSDSPLLARVDQVLNEAVELLLRQRLAERLRHHVRVVARLDVRVRIDDRLADEVLERPARLLGVLRQPVEVGPDVRRRAGRRERVAGAAAVVLEHGRTRD